MSKHEEAYQNIARKLQCRALPNKGFRGDWSLQVVPGSVSEGLGEEIIRILLSKSEDYKRFLRGIALPARLPEDEVGDIRAWPFAPDENANENGKNILNDMSLKYLLQIHDNARTRSRFRDYQQIREHLHSLAREFMALDGIQANSNEEEKINNNLKSWCYRNLRSEALKNILDETIIKQINEESKTN